MNEIELILLLLLVVAALTPVAKALRVPYPVLLVVGGLILALLPAVPDLKLEPEFVFLVFLPPLVYSAAFNTSIRDFRRLLRSILSLAVGLVLATMVVIAVVIHALVPGLGWPAAFAFGAIVSPPDAVAAAAVFRGLGVPGKIVTLLESESLVNDATALVALRFALTAGAVAFSASEAGLGFAVVAVGGVLAGLAVALPVAWLHRRISDPSVEITLSLLTPFACYLTAEGLGFSGVLAAVSAGLYFGARSSYIWGSDARLRGRAVWDMVEFILNGLVFILIGLQLSTILPTLAGRSLVGLIGLGLALSVSAIVVRMVWVYGDSLIVSLVRRLKRSVHSPAADAQNGQGASWKELFVVGWAGMRGVVSLAAVLALPQDTPERNLLIFLAFFVILATLVGQGLSLPVLIRMLSVGSDSGALLHQGTHARTVAADAASARIQELRAEWPAHLPLIDSLQAQYDHRASHLSHEHDALGEDGNGDPVDQELYEHYLIRRAVISAERSAVLDLRERGELDDSVWREIERDLDLEELRMDA